MTEPTPEKRNRRSRPAIERYLESIRVDENGCWRWQRRTERDGYGRLWVDGRNAMAHRFAYEHFVGPILDGLHIDHLCRVRDCVFWEHLEPVTPQVNILRGVGPTARNAMVTHCSNGHPYDEENTHWTKKGRACRACGREKARRDHARLIEQFGHVPLTERVPRIPLTRDHCKRGHALTPENVYITRQGSATCRTCYRDFSREYQRRKARERREAAA